MELLDHSPAIRVVLDAIVQLKVDILSIDVGKSAVFYDHTYHNKLVSEVCRKISTDKVQYATFYHRNMRATEVAAVDETVDVTEIAMLFNFDKAQENSELDEALNKLRRSLIAYLMSDYEKVRKTTNLTEDDKKSGLIEYSYILRSNSNLRVFKKMKGTSGATEAIKRTLELLVQNGEIQQVGVSPLTYMIKMSHESILKARNNYYEELQNVVAVENKLKQEIGQEPEEVTAENFAPALSSGVVDVQVGGTKFGIQPPPVDA